MEEVITKPTNCHFCGYLCAFTATVENGKVIDLEPDPTRYPYDESIIKGCRRWRLNLDFLDAETRINFPFKQAGERGSGEWKQVSWDEALDDISARLGNLIAEHGSHTVASAIGGPHGSFWPLHRFMNLIGSPNNMGIGQICWNPRIWMDAVTFGWTIEADVNPEITETLVVWGTNPAQSDNSAFWRSLINISHTDICMVVVDPRYTQTARLADIWLPIRPRTDCTLALGLMHVIIEEKLYDADFVASWCHGFEELAEQLKCFTPEYTADVCGVQVDDIRAAARAFGNARAAALISGRGIDQIGADVAPTHRAICCLRAITGNVDKPGACLLTEMSDFTQEVVMEMSDQFPEEQRQFCLNTTATPLQNYDGYDYLTSLTETQGRRLPMRYMTSAHPDLVLRAMESGKPYPIKALFVEGTNPVLTYADTNRVCRAFSALDLLVVLEYNMTPTAAMADYVLPIAGAIERPVLQIHGGVANIAYGGPAAVAPYYQRKTDYDVFRELGIRLGQAAYWPEETLEEAFANQLAEAGVSWEWFCQSGLYFRAPQPYKHEACDEAGNPRGFATETGKIELASESLTKLGGQRLPVPSAESLSYTEDFDASGLTLLTGARKQPYNASVFLDVAAFRAQYPYPRAEMSAATAEKLELYEGDLVMLQTEKGEACFTLGIVEMRDGVVSADYGWWYPERDGAMPLFGGIGESNSNLLTDCSLVNGEAMIGTWSYNALSCSIKKVDKPMTYAGWNKGENQ